MSSLVTPARADTTTTNSLPASRIALIRAATFLMRSTSPTEVPPYFWTIRAMRKGINYSLRADAIERFLNQRAGAPNPCTHAANPRSQASWPTLELSAQKNICTLAFEISDPQQKRVVEHGTERLQLPERRSHCALIAFLRGQNERR